MNHIAGLVACGALLFTTTPAFGAATVSDECGAGINSIPGQEGCNFVFWDGRGDQQVQFTPSSFHFVTSQSGNQTQVLKGESGSVENPSDAPIVYSAFSGPPVEPGQTCWNFQYDGFEGAPSTTNWQLVIEVDGSWTLTCNFKK
jgi:hypothetical protein